MLREIFRPAISPLRCERGAKAAARRELLEETGYGGGQWHSLGRRAASGAPCPLPSTGEVRSLPGARRSVTRVAAPARAARASTCTTMHEITGRGAEFVAGLHRRHAAAATRGQPDVEPAAVESCICWPAPAAIGDPAAEVLIPARPENPQRFFLQSPAHYGARPAGVPAGVAGSDSGILEASAIPAWDRHPVRPPIDGLQRRTRPDWTRSR